MFQNHIPARGRKRVGNIEDFCHDLFFKTTSPQGDGNDNMIVSLHDVFLRFQNHIPARGRKHQFNRSFNQGNELVQNHIPARGRKPVGFTNHHRLCEVISKPHPRKGTERANPSLPCRGGGGGPCEAWWKGRLERSTHLHRKKVTSAASAPTGSHCSPPPPFRRGRRIEHHPRKGTETCTFPF